MIRKEVLAVKPAASLFQLEIMTSSITSELLLSQTFVPNLKVLNYATFLKISIRLMCNYIIKLEASVNQEFGHFNAKKSFINFF